MKKYIIKEKTIILIIIIMTIAVSLLYISNKTIYDGVDTKYHISRIIGITNSWKGGDLLSFIHLDDTGYGYGIGFFYSNVFMAIPSIMYLLGMNIISAYKTFIILCTIATAISMYVCTKKISNNRYAAIISTVIYTTCSYRIITILAKSFVGEILSFIFIPIIILGLHNIIFEDEKKWWLFAIGFIGILNSNLVMTEIMIAISTLMLLVNIKKLLKNKNRLKALLKASIVALFSTAIFWMPMLEQLKNTTFKMKSMMEVYQPYRWSISWKNVFLGTIQYEKNLAAAYGMGIIFLIIIISRLTIKVKDKTLKYCDIYILIGLILIFCMTDIFPWKYLKQLGGMFQFQSRLEVPIAAFFSIACGIICSYLSKDIKKTKITILIIICVWQIVVGAICTISCIETLKKFYNAKTIEEIKIDEDFEYDICDGVYLPEGASYEEAKIKNKYEPINSQITTNNEELEYDFYKTGLNVSINFKNNNIATTYIEVPMYYYYGYTVESANDGNYRIEQGDKGLIRIYLEENQEDTIQIFYKYTFIQKLGLTITTIFLISLICLYTNQRKKLKSCNQN